MNKFFKISLGALLFFSLVLVVKAAGLDIRGPQTTAITFPIAALGNCNSKQECKTYCDKAENISGCATFAQANGLISSQEKQQADNLSTALKSGAGPGGCTDAASCSSYCADSTHTDECVAFAQKNNLIPKQKIDSAKKVGQALKSGGGPGGCKSDSDCQSFCSKTENQQTCLDFGKKQGLVSKQDSQTLDKFSSLVKAGQTPGSCTSKDTCQTYCQDQSHKDECLKFLVTLGTLDTQAAAKIKQSGTTGPGGCTSKDTCDTYCSDQTHQQECVNFAKERGLNVNTSDQQTLNDNGTSDNNSGDQHNPGSNGSSIKDCVFKALGLSASSTLDTANLTAEQKAAIAQCRPQAGGGNNDNNKNSGQGEVVKNCVFKALGLQSTDTLDTKNLTTEQKAAIQKCLPQNHEQQKPPQQKTGGSASTTPASQHGPEKTSAVTQCLKDALGADGFQKLIKSSPQDRGQYADTLKKCGYPTQKAGGQNSDSGTRPSGSGGTQGSLGQGGQQSQGPNGQSGHRPNGPQGQQGSDGQGGNDSPNPNNSFPGTHIPKEPLMKPNQNQ